MEHRDEHPAAFDLCFGRRPAEELFDLTSDRFQVENLASDPAHAETLAALRARLDRRLRALEDPRSVGGAEIFGAGAYRGSRR